MQRGGVVAGLWVLVAAAAAACAPEGEATSAATGAMAVETSGEMALPIDARKLLAHVRARRLGDKAAVLAALPEQLRTRFVLMKKSGGLQAATPERPRVLHFTEDARFILASSGVAADPASRTLEILELDEAAATYRAHSLVLDGPDGPELVENDPRCAECHGVPARPIWGDYPSWPGAYGGSRGHEGVDHMTPDELATFAAFADAARTDPDYRHLEIHRTAYGYRLPTAYSYPLTVFTARLGVRYGAAVGARLAASPDLPRLEHALVATRLGCAVSTAVSGYVSARYAARVAGDAAVAEAEAAAPATSAATRIFRILGVDPATDLRLERRAGGAAGAALDADEWNAGGDYLPALASFEVFRRVVAADAELTAAYAPTMGRIDAIERVLYGGTAETLATLGPSSELSYFDSIFPFFHLNVDYPVLNPPAAIYPGAGQRDAVCARLDALQRARQVP